MLSDWELVKRRTAASGAVWRSADGPFYKRTGGESVHGEAAFQIDLAKRSSPVSSVTECGLKRSNHAGSPGGAVSRLRDWASRSRAEICTAEPTSPLPTYPDGSALARAWSCKETPALGSTK
jgi:hypothetical protein